ncbi:MAG: glycogen debranching protein GlgX [Spirochaetaceae bacterium]|jgi:glycogen operon protein|nr:glycogen debranching protein GlgX [Spirochaetaceae bacterium]
MAKYIVEIGKSLPFGATLTETGVNFSVFSRNATAVFLLLFDSSAPDSSYETIPLKNRTGDIWHCHILGIGAGSEYLYRAEGSYIPEKGFRFNSNRALLDPYAKSLSHNQSWNFSEACAYQAAGIYTDLSFSCRDNVYSQPRCIVIDDRFDWQGDTPLNYPLRLSVLYETHVRGLTIHPSSKVQHPGTYSGVIEKIPFFKNLGITSVEFLPLQEFNEKELSLKNPRTGQPLVNYWGYSTIAFFAPKRSYSSDTSSGGEVREFKEMVREMHKAGIEVILDIVFNHTAEGNEWGPTLSFRGLDNSVYYILQENPRYYLNYSGCGNTMNCNNPVVRSFIIDCLRYWVVEMHVDGFRFDLGSILGRDQNGNLMDNPPTLELIAEDPVLRHTKIIAEAWDAGGAYQVGWFPGGRWAEWNDKYRDDLRRFWRGDAKQTRYLATRLAGSSDLYLRDGRKPFHSINFITSHDGFTLRDLVSYQMKHNEENGEENHDGSNTNYSASNGFEGITSNPAIERIRKRLAKNFIATLMLSLGTPMLLGGDEFGRTQRGNNNAYCQDNETSWYDWTLLMENADLFRFTKEMIAFRLQHPCFMRPEFYTGHNGSYNAMPDITWFDEKGKTPDWDKVDLYLSMLIDGSKADSESDKDDSCFFIMCNAGNAQKLFTVCPLMGKREWRRVIDTGFPLPDDILLFGTEKLLADQDRYLVQGRSLVVLISH